MYPTFTNVTTFDYESYINYSPKIKEIAEEFSCSISNEQQLSALNNYYFNEEILEIIKQMFFIKYSKVSEFNYIQYKTIETHNIHSEPILFSAERNRLIFTFNVPFIMRYFNQSFDYIEIKEKTQQFKQKHLTLRDDAPYEQKMIVEDNITGITLTKLQQFNLTKIYVLVDHAVEHLKINNDNTSIKNLDRNHKKFGQNIEFLSALITTTPNDKIHTAYFTKHSSFQKLMFYGNDTSSESSSENED